MAKKDEAKSIAKQQKQTRQKGSAYAVYDGKGKAACKLASLDSSCVPLAELQKRYTFHDVSAKATDDHKHESARYDHKHKREPRNPVYREYEKNTRTGIATVCQKSMRGLIQTTRPE